jgi:radical SAM superfamily enzyme YgiQ (UPF0313 family)
MRVLYLQLPVVDFGYDYWEGDHPLAGGMLAAYALSRGLAHEPIFLPSSLTSMASDPALVAAIVELRPDVIAATLNLWNVQRTISIIKAVTERIPSLRALAGGPEAVGDFNRRFPGHPFHLVHSGEGEGVFASVLDLLMRDGTAGVEDIQKAAMEAPKEVTLEDVASPYLEGILSRAPDGSVWVESMRGCPFRCAYCYYGKEHRGVRWYPEEWIRTHLDWACRQGAEEFYFLDPSFQIHPGLEERLRKIIRWNWKGVPLFTESRVEGMTPRLADLFARAGFACIETGMQSIHRHVLEPMGRSCAPNAFAAGAGMLMEKGIRIYVDIILGLPGDDLTGFLKTVGFLVERELHEDLMIFPLLVLPGTRLREEAGRLGIRFRNSPPYQVIEVEGFDLADMRRAVDESENMANMDVFPLHLPHLAVRQDGPFDLAQVVDVDIRQGLIRVGLHGSEMERLAQCPVFLFVCGDGPVPWDLIRKWAQWQRRELPHLLPFWGIEVERPFSIQELEITLDIFHEAESFQAGLWSFSPDPYRRLSCRPFVLSSCMGEPSFWLQLNEVVPVIRRVRTIPLRGRAGALWPLAVLWDTRERIEASLLRSLLDAFEDREKELLFSEPENARTWSELTGLPRPPDGVRLGRVKLQ